MPTAEIINSEDHYGHFATGQKIGFEPVYNGYRDLYLRTGSRRNAPVRYSVDIAKYPDVVKALDLVPDLSEVTLKVGEPRIAFGRQSNKPFLAGMTVIEVLADAEADSGQ